MRRRPEPLLCELHAHTTWSDGAFALPELVDMYGRAGFDVLAVTDHVNRPDDPLLPPHASPRGVVAATQDAYLAEIDAEAERARTEYDLLVLPGVELSYNDLDPLLAAHAVAVGLRTFVPLDGGLDPALDRAREEGAALIAAPSCFGRGAASHRAARRCGSRATGALSATVSTAGSSSTATTSSAGSPSAGCRRSPRGTFIARSTSTDGRPSCPVARTTRPWSSTCARTDRPS